MARTWTERRIGAPDVVKAADHNTEHASVARQVNGNLDQHNVPLRSITSALLVPGTVVLNGNTLSTYLAANSYHRSVLPAAGLDTAQIDLDPDDDVLGGGWNSLAALLDDDGFVCEFTGRDGMIHAHALLDFERRSSFVKFSDGGADIIYSPTHDGDRLQIGVFLNGVLVADSGPIPCRRFTIDLPFSYPCPAGPVRIETKFKALTTFQAAAGFESDTTPVRTSSFPSPAERYPHIKFHAAAIYARNQYR